MRQRAISSVGIVVVGLLPALLGGWVFAITFTLIAAIAYREALAITAPPGTRIGMTGLGIVVIAGVLGITSWMDNPLALLVGLAMIVPLVATVFLVHSDGIALWSTTTASTLYLAVPTFAAIALRDDASFPAREWVGDLAGVMPEVSDRTGGGLAWFLLALLVTWLSDTFAYLVGRTWGRRKLIPRVSPNKTIEGATGGLVAAALTAVACDALFGMDIGLPLALLVGTGLGLMGQVGDLSESMLKRMRGVKDSGNLIPGHGGMLDRVDALLFVLTATWVIAPWLQS
jgi:phosphatidate cytidylyltransferase